MIKVVFHDVGDLTHSNDFNHQLYTDEFQVLPFLLSSGSLFTNTDKASWMASRNLTFKMHESKLIFLVYLFLLLQVWSLRMMLKFAQLPKSSQIPFSFTTFYIPLTTLSYRINYLDQKYPSPLFYSSSSVPITRTIIL